MLPVKKMPYLMEELWRQATTIMKSLIDGRLNNRGFFALHNKKPDLGVAGIGSTAEPPGTASAPPLSSPSSEACFLPFTSNFMFA